MLQISSSDLLYHLKSRRPELADSGTALFHSTIVPYESFRYNFKNLAVVAWDLEKYQPRFTRPGLLIGKSLDGYIFLTCRLIEAFDIGKVFQWWTIDFDAWRVEDGKRVDLNSLTTDHFAFNQRTLVFRDKYNDDELRVYDVLAESLSRPITVSDLQHENESLSGWAIAPNGAYILVRVNGESIHGHNWVRGRAIGITQEGTEILPTSEEHPFRLDRFLQDHALFHFSAEHNLFTAWGESWGLLIRNVDGWQEERLLRVAGSAAPLSFHPTDSSLIAVAITNRLEDRNVCGIEFFDWRQRYEHNQREAEIQAKSSKRIDVGWLDQFCFDSTGDRLLCVSGGDIHIWEVNSSMRLATLLAVQAEISV